MYTHIINWDPRTTGINCRTLLKEILGSFDGVQYDDNLPKSLERQDIPWYSCQKRTFANERVWLPYFSENLE